MSDARNASLAVSTAPVRRLPPSHPDGIKRVQVGCGPKNIFPHWWNVDIRPFDGIDQAMDVTKPWPWRDVLDYVYGEHFLEHLEIEGALAFLTEAGRALRRGGRLRLSTPSLEWVLKSHFTFEEMPLSRRIDQTFGVNRAFHGWGHCFLYSKDFLEYALAAMKYEDIRFFPYGQSDDAQLANLERHGRPRIDHGFPNVWIVEAARGGHDIQVPKELSDSTREHYVRYVKSGH